jgi:hypothetical protein
MPDAVLPRRRRLITHTAEDRPSGITLVGSTEDGAERSAGVGSQHSQPSNTALTAAVSSVLA